MLVLSNCVLANALTEADYYPKVGSSTVIARRSILSRRTRKDGKDRISTSVSVSSSAQPFHDVPVLLFRESAAGLRGEIPQRR